MPAPPTGTVTFLFTDIERSTAQWEEHPEAMDAGLPSTMRSFGGSPTAHAGYVFSTGGDGFAVAFETAHAGLDAATEIQRALDEEAWPGPVTLRVRMALHTGEANEHGPWRLTSGHPSTVPLG